MTTLETPGLKSIVGLYSTSAVDWIAEHIVTEAMVDDAIRCSARRKCEIADEMLKAARRAKARRNIAIGIRAGSYWPYFS